jgi:DNA-binding IscR family transcriptional regulator
VSFLFCISTCRNFKCRIEITQNCENTSSCQLAQCLDEAELEILSADLTTLADMLASILARGGSEPEEMEADSD